MYGQLEQFFADPAKATLFSMFVGGGITWLASWRYYKKAGNELRAETALLRQANMAIVYMLQHPGANIEVKRDAAGNPVGLSVAATGHAPGKGTAKAVGGSAQSGS